MIAPRPKPAGTSERRRRFRAGHIAGWLIGGIIFVYSWAGLWRTSYPSLPSKITLQITFARGFPGFCEPLVTTGAIGDGDFLAVRYLDAENAVLLYDVWGMGGPTSRPFPLHAGERRTLEIQMPTLPHVSAVRSHEKRPLRVVLDGEVLLDEAVYFHRRQPQEIFFAINPIGGTLTTGVFRGELARPDGRELRGGPEAMLGIGERLRWIIRVRSMAALIALAVAIAFGLLVAATAPKIARIWQRGFGRSEAVAAKFRVRPTPSHGWFLATAAGCTLLFAAIISAGTFRLIYPEPFGHFYDYQALSLVEGRLDLPPAAHSSESFVFEGRHYIYFGPTPALLRLPLVIFKIAIGQWSRCYMVGYYVALLAAVYALLIHVNRLATGANTWPSRGTVVLFVTTTGLGTTMFFLGSRAYIYHEAILCGAMFALWSGVCALRFLHAPATRWWVGALVLGIAAVHARPSTGLFALSLLAAAAAAHGIRAMVTRHGAVNVLGRTLVVAGLAVLGVLSYNGVSYLKFKSFEGMPLRYNVQYDPERLAAFEGKNFHLANLGFNFGTYFWRPDFVLRPAFPFFYITGANTHDFVGVKSDLAEPAVAMPYTMPAMFLLAFGGGALALVLWPAAREPLVIIAVAAIPMSAALLTAVVVSERYTADFCPALILAGAFGLQTIELLPRVGRRCVFAMLVIFSVIGISATSAITLHYQGEAVWGVPDEVRTRYESLRKTADRLLGLGRE